MTTLRRLLSLAVALSVGLLLAAVVPATASAPAMDRLCRGHAPIPARALAHGLSTRGCSLTGRTVYAGRAAVVVPPPGVSVAGSGTGTRGDVAGLGVENTGSVVRAWTGDDAAAAPERSTSARTSPPACKDRAFRLEHHRWTTPFRYRIKVAAAPKRFQRATLVRQIKAGNANMRLGRNTCGRARLGTPAADFLGRTRSQPDIVPGTTRITCGHYNTRNVVGFGTLPGGLLGWTCYWWLSTGTMGAADVMLAKGKQLTTHLPRHCHDRWDLEGVVTHEFGHVYGLAHTGPGHTHLTMEHRTAPCSTYARTLGLGDWLGMRTMYGVR